MELTEEEQFVKFGIKDLLLNSYPLPLFIRMEPQKGFFQADHIVYFKHFTNLGKEIIKEDVRVFSNIVLRISNGSAETVYLFAI